MANLCDINGKKADITYPCKWKYKLIVLKQNDIKTLLLEKFGKQKYTLKSSHESKSGTYQSYDFMIKVKNEKQRLEYFEYFKTCKDIKFVL